MFNFFRKKRTLKTIEEYAYILNDGAKAKSSNILDNNIIKIDEGQLGIKHFKIKKIQSGIEPSIICIDGFLSEDYKNPESDWEQLFKLYPDNSIFHVEWESDKLKALAIKTVAVSAVLRNLGRAATVSGTIGLTGAVGLGIGGLGSLGLASSALPVAALTLGPVLRSWSVACTNAEKTGELLSEIIKCTNKEYILIGHSLGSRVIHSCLSNLRINNHSFIKEVHLLGGAVDIPITKEGKSSKTDWNGINKIVSGKIYNYYSDGDDVLKYFYRVAQRMKFSFGEPIGINKIEFLGVENEEAKKDNKSIGHMEYKNNLENILIKL